MATLEDPKAVLHRYLRTHREAVVWKLDGISERDARLPRTPTGTNLIGLVKHLANVEIGYFGDTFGRTWPTPEERVSEAAYEEDPQADLFATADESVQGLVDLYRRVWAFSDETIESLPIEAVGNVPWWAPQRRQVTLGRILTHVVAETARHAGHADILRESIDGAAGVRPDSSGMGDEDAPIDWAAYVRKLTAIADTF